MHEIESSGIGVWRGGEGNRAGIVDQDVDPAELLAVAAHGGAHGLFIANVEG